MSGGDSSGLRYIAGWCPADTEFVYFRVRYDVAITLERNVDLRGLIAFEDVGWPYIIAIPADAVGEVTIMAYTKDRIITRVGNQLATSTPR